MYDNMLYSSFSCRWMCQARISFSFLIAFGRITLVESIPENVTFAPGSVTSLSTYDAWRELLARATTSIDLAVFYWTLRGDDVFHDPSDEQVRCFSVWRAPKHKCVVHVFVCIESGIGDYIVLWRTAARHAFWCSSYSSWARSIHVGSKSVPHTGKNPWTGVVHLYAFCGSRQSFNKN